MCLLYNMNFIMKLSEPHFTNTKNNKKTVEIRIYDDKRKKLKINDIITFKNSENNKSFKRKIKNIKVFNSFEKAIKYAKLKNCLPGIKTYKEAIKLYHSFPNYKKLEKKFGVIAIFF
jgi:ASC-1-like (ASCH) protein